MGRECRQLSEWDPTWAAYAKMNTNPETSSVPPRKFIELVGIGLNAACTNLNRVGDAQKFEFLGRHHAATRASSLSKNIGRVRQACHRKQHDQRTN